MMERFIYVMLMVLVLNVSCKSKEEDNAGPNPDEIESEDSPNTLNGSGKSDEEDEGSSLKDLFDLDANDLKEGTLSNNGSAAILYQMLGKVSVDKKTFIKADLDSLKTILDNHLDLNQAIVIGETTVDVNFSNLVQILSEMDGKDLQTINAILPKITSSAASQSGRAPHPFSGTYIEETLKNFPGGSIQNRVDSKRLYQTLRNASPEEAQQKLANHYGIDLEEVELLKSILSQPEMLNEKQARDLAQPIYSEEVEAALAAPNTSDNFKLLVKKNKEVQQRNADKFLKRSSGAREAFYKLNPSWYSGKGDEAGNTYSDTRNKQIYLPLGKRSFADAVVSFDPGNGGQFPEGALHEPDLTVELARLNKAKPEMCSIGLKGVLTLQFLDNAITDVNGPDLYVFEAGAIEPTILELSKDGSNWLEVGKIEGGTAMVDIHDFVKPGETFTYVRLTDLETRSGVPGADVDAVAAIGGALRLNLDSSVLFEFGKYDLRPEAEALLVELIPQIESMRKGTIVVEGHTDNVGSVQANKKLSEQRANSVSILLKIVMKETADNFKWEIRGHGDSQPIAPNDSDENRQKNRRVELLVLPN